MNRGAPLQDRPRNPARRELDDQYKLDVKAAMAAQKPPWSQRKLAAEIGVTSALVNKLLKPIAKGGLQVTALLPIIKEKLGVPLPHERSNLRTDRRRRIDALVDRMDEEQLENAARFLESVMTRK